MKKFLFASLLFLSSLGLYAENERTIIVTMYPDGEKTYAGTTIEDIYKNRTLLEDSIITAYGKTYVVAGMCKVRESPKYNKLGIKMCKFDTLGTFEYVSTLVEFNSITSAKLWISGYNDSEVFATNFNFSDIDLLTDRKYYVFDKTNEVFIEIRKTDIAGRLHLDISTSFEMPYGLKRLIEKEEEANNAKKPKPKTKKKKK